MRILIVEPDRHSRIAEIPHTLKAMQQTVGGYIEITYPWSDPIALVCDEEGLLKQLPFNRLVAPGSAIFGTFFLCGRTAMKCSTIRRHSYFGMGCRLQKQRLTSLAI